MKTESNPELVLASKETLLTAQEVADRFQVPLATVYVWRSRPGKGPRGMRIGRYVRYRLADVLAFEEAHADYPQGAA